MKQINNQTAWACASGKIIMPWSVRSTRAQSIRDFETNFGRKWAELKRKGYSVTKVVILPQ